MNQFVTTDTPLATYLTVCGYEPEITLTKHKVQFKFTSDLDGFQIAVDRFQSGIAVGNIPQYHDTYQRLIKYIRELKRASHD